jgi:hypothetical protein
VSKKRGKKMKKIIFIILIAAIILPCLAFLETAQKSWYTVRSAVTANDAALGVTGRKWADRPDPCMFSTTSIDNALVLRFRFSTAAATCDYELWQYCENDDAELVAAGTATAGTQTATDGGYYAHKITITSRWISTWASTDITGNNEMCKIHGDGCGGAKWYVRLASISAGSVSVDKRSF